MSTHTFSQSTIRISRKDATRVRQIAAAHDVQFHEITGQTAGTTGYKSWFTGPSLGFPFDRDLAQTVDDAVAEAGIIRVDDEYIVISGRQWPVNSGNQRARAERALTMAGFNSAPVWRNGVQTHREVLADQNVDQDENGF